MTKTPWISPGEQRYVCYADAIYLMLSNAIYLTMRYVAKGQHSAIKSLVCFSKHIACFNTYRFPKENIANPARDLYRKTIYPSTYPHDLPIRTF